MYLDIVPTPIFILSATIDHLLVIMYHLPDYFEGNIPLRFQKKRSRYRIKTIAGDMCNFQRIGELKLFVNPVGIVPE